MNDQPEWMAYLFGIMGFIAIFICMVCLFLNHKEKPIYVCAKLENNKCVEWKETKL